MSNRVFGRTLRNSVAVAGMLAAAAALSGCTAIGGRAMGDPMTTGSIASNGAGNLQQPMPTLQGNVQVAGGPYVPPADIGGGVSSPVPMAPVAVPTPVVSSQDLPALTSSNGTLPMPAQPNVAPIAVTPRAPMLGNPAPAAAPSLAVVPSDAYVHVIKSGESLYTIARQYDVTAQAIVQANGFSSPDKIFVGQKIVIPGRPDLLAARGGTQVASVEDQPTQAPVVTPVAAPTTTAAIADPGLLQTQTQPPAQQQATAAQPAQLEEPKMSGAEKFRWPVSGKVITDFANSKGTGINIEAPEGSPIRAAENGTVIYVGSGVQGYGNLILIRHANGYVSAYAHLRDMGVTKGQVVNRGDNIGSAGMTGSVSRPQLHFELRRGATPVDPIPLLAS